MLQLQRSELTVSVHLYIVYSLLEVSVKEGEMKSVVGMFFI